MNTILDKKTLNIFTDASISKMSTPSGDIVIGSAGAQFYMGTNLIDSKYQILYDTTNNQSELTAILIGVYNATLLRNKVDHINLFSDSRISVDGLRSWIFRWTRNIYNGEMLSSSGSPVANQQILLKIIDVITANNLRINIYHVRGHLDNNTYKSRYKFENSFLKHNKLQKRDVSGSVIDFLIQGNSSIDNYTRSQFNKDIGYCPEQVPPFIIDKMYYIENFNRTKYAELIGVRRN